MCSIQYDNAWGQQGKMEQKDRVQIEMQCNVTAAPVRKTNIRHLEHKNWPCPAGAEVSNIKHVSKKTLWMPKLRNQKARQEGCGLESRMCPRPVCSLHILLVSAWVSLGPNTGSYCVNVSTNHCPSCDRLATFPQCTPSPALWNPLVISKSTDITPKARWCWSHVTVMSKLVHKWWSLLEELLALIRPVHVSVG